MNALLWILNGASIVVFAAVVAWAAFDVHDRLGYVFIAQIVPLMFFGVRIIWRLRSETPEP